jgi:hypothetical protein
MKPGMSLRVLMAGVALAASALLAGCASAPPRAERFVAAPAGTAYAFHRRSTGSFGAMDGTVDWTLENREWQGQPMMAQVSPQAGTLMHEFSSGSFGYVATLKPRGQTNQHAGRQTDLAASGEVAAPALAMARTARAIAGRHEAALSCRDAEPSAGRYAVA